MAYKLLLVSLCLTVASADKHTTGCPDDPDVDLCDLPAPEPDPAPSPSGPSPSPSPSSQEEASGAMGNKASKSLMMVLTVLAMGRQGPGGALLALPLMFGISMAAETSGSASASTTCGAMKEMYKSAGCCGAPDKDSGMQVVPMQPVSSSSASGTNVCADKKELVYDKIEYFNNVDCLKDGVFQSAEQSGTNVTVGYKGDINTTGRAPILDPYWKVGLCPVNVHWHLGAEHLSEGQYDYNGTGPEKHRRLAADARLGFRCHHYDKDDAKFTTEYDWKHCVGMHVGETYEVHWPHSAAGACGTPNQYQTPFYDGVFCTDGVVTLDPLNTYFKVGVQGQVYTIVNDEKYYYPNMMRGMIVDGEYGADIAKYTGSTTGTTRNNEVCSRYTPITWQVDRKCHLISASSFDKMCADMKLQRDDMSDDLYAHGARELVATQFAADNHQRLLSEIYD